MCEEKWKRKRRKQNEKKEAESLWDVYDDVIGKPEGVDYTLVLSSSTDAQITEDGVLQVDYDGRNDTAASRQETMTELTRYGESAALAVRMGTSLPIGSGRQREMRILRI